MPIGDPIPGWGQTPGQAPAAVPQSSIPDRLAETWQLYRRYLRAQLELALPIQGLLGLIYAPASVGLIFAVEQQWGNGAFGSDDPETLRRTLSAYFPDDLPSVVGRSLAPAAGLLVVILLTVAFALFMESGRAGAPLVRPRLGAIVARASVFALPLAIVALAGAALTLLEAAFLTRMATASSVALDTVQSRDLTGSVFAIDGLILILAIVVIYAVCRWTLAIPVAAIERLGLRSALARSTELSRGYRLHILLSLAVVSFGTGLVIAAASWGASLLAGMLFGSGSVLAFAAGLLAILAALVVTAPLIPILIVTLYRGIREQH